MLEKLKRMFGITVDDGVSADHGSDHDLNVALCALFLEMGRIDETFTEQELAKVISILRDKYGVSEADADALMDDADRELEQSVDLWQFARVINDHFTIPQKEKRLNNRMRK